MPSIGHPLRRLAVVLRVRFAAALTAALTVAAVTPAAAAPTSPQFGPAIEGWPRYEAPTTCSSTIQPGVQGLREVIVAAYGWQSIGLLRGCAAGPASSDHHEGRALDWMLSAADPTQKALADDFLGWLSATDEYGNEAAAARRLGISYVIWDRRVWKAYRPADGWQPYTGTTPHTDHIHISLTWRGAEKETSWWTRTPDAIDSHWTRIGGAALLGGPMGQRRKTSLGEAQDYERGGMYLPSGGRAKEVHGSIGVTYRATGAEHGPLGYPLTDETPTPSRPGAYNHFQKGSVYWSPGTGAHVVWGAVRDRWARSGWENGFLGFPVTDEFATPVKPGAYNHFEGGSVYWSAATGAREVHGAIRERWAAMGWENSRLGFPVTDEHPTPARTGAFSHFAGGSIYWSPRTGAWPVWGAIRGRWAADGWENGPLGFPVGAEVLGNGGAQQQFEGGVVTWDATTNATSVRLG